MGYVRSSAHGSGCARDDDVPYRYMFLVFTVVVSWVEYRISVLSIDPVTLFDLIHESVLEARRLPLVLD